MFAALVLNTILAVPVVSQALHRPQVSRPAYLRVKNGDIIFQTSLSSQSQAIQLATRSRYSHMGIVFMRNGKPYVFEAIGRASYTPLAHWIRRGHKGHYVIKRLKPSFVKLDKSVISKLESEAARLAGKPYDLLFGWDDDKMYCSELVWKIYYRATGIKIGKRKTLRSFNLEHPVVRKKLFERYGKKIPLNMPVISPADMFNSSKLHSL